MKLFSAVVLCVGLHLDFSEKVLCKHYSKIQVNLPGWTQGSELEQNAKTDSSTQDLWHDHERIT